ncbi:MAG: sigma-70 family RNA polymerase sigma factor [Candidatus Kapabacteria bacterium]|jgi:RNA polymerase sigma-70 factor (ECF subfamily)|nr:sigma-70 family RNA polymerase sigma factor [Candidatus Kapabacteria bacterium]
MTNAQLHTEFLDALEKAYPALERLVRALVWKESRRRFGQVLHSQDLVQDIIAETVAAAFEQYPTLRHKEAFLSYCFTIATRTHRKMVAQSERLQTASNLAFATESVGDVWERLEQKGACHDHGTDYQSERAADTAALYEAFDTLPAEQREALIMFEILGFSMKEIAEVQNRSTISVKVSVSRGRKLLAKRLGAA